MVQAMSGYTTMANKTMKQRIAELEARLTARIEITNAYAKQIRMLEPEVMRLRTRLADAEHNTAVAIGENERLRKAIEAALEYDCMDGPAGGLLREALGDE